VSINDVIDRAVAFCEHEIAGASVAIERTFDPDVGPVRGLPEQLAQVFVNLVTNACHAMSPSDHPSRPAVLRLSTTAAGAPGCPRVTVIVQDSGSGIAPEHLGLVFNPFFTTKAVGRGTGLGLSIVKKIVDGHAGDIRAESDPSYGTRFVLSFPVEARSAGPSDDGGSAPR
jgi:signal transduction histidine kinase